MPPGFPRKIVRITVGSRRSKLALDAAKEFESTASTAQLEKMQLASFNSVWNTAQRLPFYREWRNIHDLPQVIDSIRSLDDWPVLTKEDLRTDVELVNLTPGIVGSYRTSGSTSEPFDFPRGPDEFESNYSSAWSYRVSHGLRPFDPFLLTANTISGAGQSRFNQVKARSLRAAKDIAGNSWKVNGFIPTSESADGAIKAIQATRPRYIVGYTSAIANIARRANERSLHFPFLTNAIFTSETIHDVDLQQVRDYLGVDTLIEYGAVELGVIAGTPNGSPGWPIKTHHRHALVRTGRDSDAVVTTLAPRLFPLINYGIGDHIEAKKVSPSGSVLEINSVKGRTRDYVNLLLNNGLHRTLSARELIYLVRDIKGIDSAQVSQFGDGKVDIIIVSPHLNAESTIRKITSSIGRNNPDLARTSISVIFAENHIAGARGKRGAVVPRDLISSDLVRHPLPL